MAGRINSDWDSDGDICIYCDKDTMPVGFWGTDGEWVGPFPHDPVCAECYKHYPTGTTDWADSTVRLHVLRKRLDETQEIIRSNRGTV